MNISSNGEKEPPGDEKDAQNGVSGDRRRLNQSDLKADASCQVDIHGATASRSQGSGIVQFQQQVPGQGSVVCWERFLHVRTIRVLLVENDDSTRQVVTALLRNCNYEVVDAANGLQAWKILEDLNNHIDIVLTEVVMPCLSGIGLLCKILTHKTRKTVPVIMMSTHDSMGLVFKCLSRGAVDFLVKPIRKNELKNLWQHVWRRCHSSSGSGSESGTQTQKSVKSKASDKSGNSDEEENNASKGLNTGDTSDDGSGAQSSWTKQALEVDSSQALSPIKQVSECPDSTCAQVINSNAEYSDYNKVQLNVAREGHGLKLPDTVENENGVEKIMHINVTSKLENHMAGQQSNPTGRELESTGDATNTLDLNNNATDDSKESDLELNLKRLRGEQDRERSVQSERYVLRRSEQSAFSRYNTSTNIFKPPNAITGSSYLLDNSVEAAKRESVGDRQVFSTDHILYQSSNGVSNNVDMGSTTYKLPRDKSEATSAVNDLDHSAIRPVKNDTRYNSQQQVSLLPNGMKPTDREPQIEHTHYHRHKPSSNHDERSLMQFVADDPHCGSTNVLVGPILDGNNTRNCSLNRSASGSNHGSNGHNGSSNAFHAVGNNNAESDFVQAGKSRSGDASGSGCGGGNKVDEIRFAQREAALIKFRRKRKERCFQKKVRYQNRKKLAEQRPRVRGQFVKQAGTDCSHSSGGE